MFPPVESADEDGFLCWGGRLSVATLHLSYRSGIFPWPQQDSPVLWFAPPRRALLFCDELHIGSRLARYLKAKPFEIRVNTQFETVMRECAAPRESDRREGHVGTWITPQMQRAYAALHRAGNAHSVEAWQDNQLVGGLYGVQFGAYFCGESMFARQDNASKAALIWLVKHLQSCGATWIDCQMMTPHFQVLGAREVERSEFTAMLQYELSREIELFPQKMKRVRVS
ncbi:leucyl/phenylalanyl-tRNA--protein transferase [Abditibacterium utsteinense]|uniref:Leucyl/phenylalanyl-tRNA--protein transferase n=1 Tax=Abditibacterium utsteinense TaxID=1960156 RepID=A0A2S8ST05_9BACT|nr:leucyl/phenylalanyl-tRNA--protein transferase [Abditibacterium utsteinense]PQV63933.1 leucyl/phenylalanyl-tRNA--protein transferase [Abditibacterium utsteinense]